jgi:hypothetical protein
MTNAKCRMANSSIGWLDIAALVLIGLAMKIDVGNT